MARVLKTSVLAKVVWRLKGQPALRMVPMFALSAMTASLSLLANAFKMNAHAAKASRLREQPVP